jgi:hypothetical protein
MVRKNTETDKPDISTAASPAPSFNINDPAFQAIHAEAVAARLSVIEADKQATAKPAKSEKSIKIELATIRAFKRLGYGIVRPRIDVMTFRRWLAEGYRPMEGSKAVRIAGLRLFHKSQCRPITKEEKAQLAADQKAALARHEAAEKANVVPLVPN